MHRILAMLLAAALAPQVLASDAAPTPSTKAGDWAKYLVTSKSDKMPMWNKTDEPKWRVFRAGTPKAFGIETILEAAGQRNSFGVIAFNPGRLYDPTLVPTKAGQVKEVSRAQETVTAAGKSYACTRVERKIDRPADPNSGIGGWRGTSTVWLSDSVPLGLVKMANEYEEDMGGTWFKRTETWVLAETGKAWKN
jgi:hypothetical protein